MYQSVRTVFIASFILVASISFNSSISAQDTDSSSLSPADVWLMDIDALDQRLRQYHPDPFFRTGEGGLVRWTGDGA